MQEGPEDRFPEGLVITADAIERLGRAARTAAASTCRVKQWIEDAVDIVLAEYVRAVHCRRDIHNVDAWAGTVARNAVRRLGRRHRGGDEDALVDIEQIPAPSESDAPEADGGRAFGELADRAGLLRGRQLEVTRKMLEPGMSLHLASLQLDMDRSNLRRTFRAALRRLGRNGS